MKNDPNGPADTRAMGIIHSALRRDLERARLVLSGQPSPARAQAIGTHLVWVMDLLHHHHTNEDDHYWPATVAKNPSAAPLLERMEADHQGLVEPIADLEREAAALAEGRDSAAAVVRAIVALNGPLNDHLRREELETMPVVAQTFTHAEHEELSKLFVQGKPPAQLIHEAMWVTDNCTREVKAQIFGTVPAPVAFVLQQTFGWRYRTLKKQLWSGTPAFDLAPITVDQASA